MTDQTHRFPPLTSVCVPVFPDGASDSAVRLAALMDAKLHLIGIIPAGKSETEQQQARQFFESLSASLNRPVSASVIVSSDPTQDLRQALKAQPVDLLCVAYESLGFFNVQAGASLIKKFPVNMALVRGAVQSRRSILLPVRGGPHAELALRIAMSIHAGTVDALHFVSPDIRVDADFKGLSRVLPEIPGVKPRYEASENPAQEIVAESAKADLVIMGTAATLTGKDQSFGPVSDLVLKESPVPVVLVHSIAGHPEFYEKDILEALLRRA